MQEQGGGGCASSRREVEVLKPRLKDARLDKRLLKEFLVRLIYVEMLGHDASWGHVKALQACSDTSLITKKVCRSACMASARTLVMSERTSVSCLGAGRIPRVVPLPGLQERPHHPGRQHPHAGPQVRQLPHR